MAPFALVVMVAIAASLLLPPPPATQVTAATVLRPRPNAGPKPYARQPIPYVRPTPIVRPPNPTFRPPNHYIPPNNPYVPTPYVPPKKPMNFNSIVQKIIRKAAKHYLKDMAKQGIRNVSSSSSSSSSSQQQQQQQHRNQLGGDAADTGAGSLVASLFIGSGTAQQVLLGVIDITSELLWVQCGYCPLCRRPQQTPTILLEASPSFYSVGCGTPYRKDVITGGQPNCDAAGSSACRYEEVFYGGDQYTSGFLATEVFTFGAIPFTGVAFGCSDNITVRGLDGGASGFLGFSRGRLSLVWQLQLYRFSYYISSVGSTAKSLFAFSWAAPVQQPAGRHYTRLLEATAKQNPLLYYVKLTGVLVDNELLIAIPVGTFDVRAADGSGGVYLSTTLPVTYLEKAAYRVLRQELVSRIQSQGVAPVSVDPDTLCYMTRSFDNIQVPQLALVFHGPDATMNLRTENYFLPIDGGQTCLTILPSTGGSVLGSLLQAGRTITYDGIQDGGGWLSFD